MIVNKKMLDDLSDLAKANPRLRQSFDLRTSPKDNSQRMLNALESGTIMPIHRHKKSSETMIMVRGSLEEYFYDEQGNLTDIFLMEAGGSCPIAQIPQGQWHSLKCLEPDTIIFEAKDCAYAPLAEDDIMVIQ